MPPNLEKQAFKHRKHVETQIDKKREDCFHGVVIVKMSNTQSKETIFKHIRG